MAPESQFSNVAILTKTSIKYYNQLLITPTFRMFPCRKDGCRMSFTYRMQRDRHHAKCEKPGSSSKPPEKITLENGKLQCLTCQHIYSDPSAFTYHKTKCLRFVAVSLREHVCDVCQKTFSKASKLKRHILTHEEKNPLLCPHCGKSYSHSHHYNVHVEKCSASEEPVPKQVSDPMLCPMSLPMLEANTTNSQPLLRSPPPPLSMLPRQGSTPGNSSLVIPKTESSEAVELDDVLFALDAAIAHDEPSASEYRQELLLDNRP